jgi:hypothetical protein
MVENMIWESGPWKVELQVVLKSFDKRRTLGRWDRLRNRLRPYWWQDAVREMELERGIFVSDFIMRKLADSNKLSFQTEHQTVPCYVHPCLSKDNLPTSWDVDRIDIFYDLNSDNPATIKARALVNMIIHSHCFALSYSESDAVDGFYVNSGNTLKKLHRITWEDYSAAAKEVVEDDVAFSIKDRSGSEERAFRSRVQPGEIDWEELKSLSPHYFATQGVGLETGLKEFATWMDERKKARG